jgi:predicted nucleic acid-binding protein
LTALTHLLDTSAWLAHLFRERGSETVSALLLRPDAQVGVALLSIVEVHARMRSLGIERRFDEVIDQYRHLFAHILPVDETTAIRAVALRQNAGAHVPAMDSHIAATASIHDAVLVHRDPHFLAIDPDGLKQEYLAARE